MSQENYDELHKEMDLNAENETVSDTSLGLSIEDVRALILRMNNTKVDADDPILVIVTILNAFLCENEKLHKKYHTALRALHAETSQGFLRDIGAKTEELSQSMKNVSVEGFNAIHEKNVALFASAKTSFLWLGAFLCVSTLLNVCALILVLVR